MTGYLGGDAIQLSGLQMGHSLEECSLSEAKRQGLGMLDSLIVVVITMHVWHARQKRKPVL